MALDFILKSGRCRRNYIQLNPSKCEHLIFIFSHLKHRLYHILELLYSQLDLFNSHSKQFSLQYLSNLENFSNPNQVNNFKDFNSKTCLPTKLRLDKDRQSSRIFSLSKQGKRESIYGSARTTTHQASFP